MVVFSVIYYELSYLRFTEFYGSNWDLGINMQALWTNTHGQLLYTAGVYEYANAGSFLLVHTTYLAIPVSWLYALAPTEGTLFALQAIIVASSAVPLYLIGIRSAAPRFLLVLGVTTYLASFPILSALLYDFHWEAFVSVEFLWTFYLLESGRFRWALVPAVLGVLTLEVFPFLALGLVACFAYSYGVEWFVSRKLSASSRRTVVSLALFLCVILALYGGLVYARGNVIPRLIGAWPSWPPPPPYTLPFLGVTYWGGESFTDLCARLLYWLLLVSAFGFLPLLYRQRLLILSIPWFVYTVFMTPLSSFTTFGFQYAFIAAPPLAVGFIEGLGDFGAELRGERAKRLPLLGWPLLLVPFLVIALAYSPMLISGAGTAPLWITFEASATVLAIFVAVWLLRRTWLRFPASIRSRLRRRLLGVTTAAKVAAIGAVLILVTTNLALSPLNTANAISAPSGGYSFDYSPSSSFQAMETLAGEIPSGQAVLASDNLFPFVANNPQAYSLLWYPGTPPYLPFNATHLPKFVLLSSSEWFAVPSFLNAVLFDQNIYGLRNELYSSIFYPGSIYLYELGYSGRTDVVEVTPFPSQTVLCGNDFDLGPSGVVVSAARTRCGVVVASRPASNLSGNNATIWYGPYSGLLAGRYNVTISLRGELSAPGPANAPILVMNANALETDFWYDVVISANMVSPTEWTNFTYHFQLNQSHPDAEWRGYIAGPTVNGTFIPGNVELNFIEVDYTSGFD